MKLSEVIKQGQQPKNGECHTMKVLASMEDEDREAVSKALEQLKDGTATFSMTWLSTQINAAGYKVSATTINRHLTGGCCCESK